MASLKKNYAYSLASQLLMILLPIVSTPYLSRVLGDTNLGVYDYILSIVHYFILFGCIGLNLYGQREIASHHRDPRAKSAIFFELTIIRLVTVSLSASIYYFVLAGRTDYPLFYRLMGVELIASLFDVSWFYQGNEDFRMQSVRLIVIRSLSLACVFLFVRSEADLDRYILCYSLSILIGNLSLWLPLRKYLQAVPFRELRFRRHLAPTLILFLPQVATNVYTQLDKTMIGLLTGHDYAQVAYYSYAEKIVKIAMTVITAIGGIMLSRIAAVLSDNDEEKARAYIRNSFRFMLLLALPMTAGFITTAGDFVPWFFGEGFEAITPCMRRLSPLVLISGVSNILGTQFLLPAKRTREYTVSILAGMAVNCALNALLIPRLQSVGAVAATLAAETAVSAVQFFFVRKTFTPVILLEGKRYLLAAVVMGAAVAGLAALLPAKPWASFLEAGAGLAIYGALLLLLRDRFVLDQLARVLGVLRKKR